METWKPVTGHHGLYAVSDQGRVYSIRRARMLMPDTTGKGGYHRVTLCDGGIMKRIFVHVIVCIAFRGPAPADAECVRHLDGNVDHNTADNLVWGTNSENEQDKRSHGTYQIRERNPAARLTEEEVCFLRETYLHNITLRLAEGYSQVDHGLVIELSRLMHVSPSCVKAVVQNRNWKEAA